MAGFFIYTFDYGVFNQLTTSPTKEQTDLIAKLILEEELMEENLEEMEEDDEDISIWPSDQDALSEVIRKRLAMQDWYSDLSITSAQIWDDIIFLLIDEPGEKMGLDLQCSSYESIYWDCADIAAEQGASMMQESVFGSSRFRFFGKPTDKYTIPMYSIYTPEQCKELLAQLETVKSYFESLPAGTETPNEQFFECLYPEVQGAVEKGRGLFVQTDT